MPGDVDLLVVGGPTHMHGLTTAMSRKMAVTASKEDAAHVEPGASEHPGLREWLRDLEARGIKAAAFDTRGDARAALTGSAARGIARRLRRRGCEVLDPRASLWQTRRARWRTASSTAPASGALRFDVGSP